MKDQPSDLTILKSNGHLESFSKRKLLQSVRRSGLPQRQCQKIVETVSQDIGEGAKTRDIYRKTLGLINQTSPLAGVHYSLKRALFDLGPSGHHFEAYVARYFNCLGYASETCRTIQGKWVKHEVDVIALRKKERYFAECKFHNHTGIKNDIKTALYVKARWDDLKEGPEGSLLSGFYLVSNTAFTKDAVTYAEGTGLRLLGVNSPAEKSFLDHIKELRLYPVTSLKSLNRRTKTSLIDQGILLASEVAQAEDLLKRWGFSSPELERVHEELDYLLQGTI